MYPIHHGATELHKLPITVYTSPATIRSPPPSRQFWFPRTNFVPYGVPVRLAHHTHASAEGLSVYSFLASILHYPVAQATSDFHTHSSAKYPSFHTINAVKIFHLVLHACLSAV